MVKIISVDMLHISPDRGSEITSPLPNDRLVIYRLINRIIDLDSELVVSLDEIVFVEVNPSTFSIGKLAITSIASAQLCEKHFGENRGRSLAHVYVSTGLICETGPL